MGGALLEGSETFLRMQNAALSRGGRSVLLASVQGALDLPTTSEQTRR